MQLANELCRYLEMAVIRGSPRFWEGPISLGKVGLKPPLPNSREIVLEKEFGGDVEAAAEAERGKLETRKQKVEMGKWRARRAHGPLSGHYPHHLGSRTRSTKERPVSEGQPYRDESGMTGLKTATTTKSRCRASRQKESGPL
jgi:hypothetical protein